MTRKQARDAAFKLLYQMQIQKEIPGNILDIYLSAV
jgi:transcription termination factor NusB